VAKVIAANDFLKMADSVPVADVRTPAEFARGHIPGALQLPLFSNEERAEVGKLYLQRGKEEAIQTGMTIAGSRLSSYVTEASNLAPGKKILLYCWRGGMRSSSLAWLLDTAGFETFVLEGGYKAYRRHVRESFSRQARLTLLGGYTGSGKTELLESLSLKGEQVLNLEMIANHKGSAFGFIGMQQQNSQEQFENQLHKEWSLLDLDINTWVEDESINIGSNQIPRALYDQMKISPLVLIEVERRERVQRLVKDYACTERELLVQCFKKIEQRLGKEHLSEALDAIGSGNFEIAAHLALHYYDKAYHHQLSQRPVNMIYTIELNCGDKTEKVLRLITDKE
jgi:tRNA 2-selenouridine synthase